jgi:hypothetical protein
MRGMRLPLLVRVYLVRVYLVSGAVAALAAGCSDDGGDALPDATSTTVTTAAPGAITTTTTVGDEPDATTTTPTDFVPPLPETTPNVSQPADSLLDGTHVVFLTDVDVVDRSIVFDLVQWFYRDDYEQAIADGRLRADADCIEFDYCMVNSDQRTRTMSVTDDARVSVVDYDDCCTFRRTDDLTDALVRLQESRDVFLVTAQGGEIIAIDEVYLS